MTFDEPINRTGTSSLKWDRYQGRDIIPLWVADMDFRSPPAVIDALRQRIEHGIFGYTLPPKDLEDAIVAHLRDDFQWQIDRQWLVWLPGVVPGLTAACLTAGNSGDEVLTMTPVYPPFLSAPKQVGRQLKQVALAEKNGHWSIDFTALAQAITARTRLLLLCSPHNPVGRVFCRQELLQLAEFCQEHDLLVCSDEIHAGLILDGERHHIPCATLSPDMAARTITLNAPSKTFNIPGLGCSFAVISDQNLRRRFMQVIEGIVPHVNLLGYTAALAAYRDSRDWHQDLLSYLRGNRNLVQETIDGLPGLRMAHVEATYLAWIDTRDTGLAAPTTFFEQAGVGLSDGAAFAGPGFVRLNFGCPRPLLQKALDRIERAIRSR
jgi:cysteine-S-conjugate beta-lyase